MACGRTPAVIEQPDDLTIDRLARGDTMLVEETALGYALAYNPGSHRTDQLVCVETSIYSITQDKLLWVGTTETVNPKSLNTLVEEVSKAVRQELVREGALPAS